MLIFSNQGAPWRVFRWAPVMKHHNRRWNDGLTILRRINGWWGDGMEPEVCEGSEVGKMAEMPSILIQLSSYLF